MSGTTPKPMSSSSPERTRLAATLRELKERTGLSLAGLAERTPYSKSSWDRYLNGKALPPRQAVKELCVLAREPEGRCLALWEIAESEWSGRAADGPSTPTPPPAASSASAPPPVEDTRTNPQRTTIKAALVAACAVLAGIVTVAVLLPGPDEDEPQASPSPSPSWSPPGARCSGAACEGENPDPEHMNCGSPPDTLLEHRTATGAWISVRYDKECGASWARTWHTSIGDRVEVTADGATYSAEIKDDADAENYVYTAMTATRPGTTVRVCFQPATNGERECVDSRVP